MTGGSIAGLIAVAFAAGAVASAGRARHRAPADRLAATAADGHTRVRSLRAGRRARRVIRPALGALVGTALAGFPAAAIGLVAVAAGQAAAEWLERERRRDRVERDLGAVADLLAREIASGATVAGALDSVRATVDGPISEEIAAIVARYRSGVAIDAALGQGARTTDQGMAALFVALNFGGRLGGPTSALLGEVAAGARERRELDQATRVAAAQARVSAAVVGMLPLLFAGVLVVADPDALSILATWPLGVVCLVSGLTLDGIGLWWMTRLADGIR